MSETAFLRALIEATGSLRSWRERLGWVRDRLLDPAFPATPERLAAVAVYLRFLATGEVRCEEDGRHYRPNHHAEAALQIETALERLSTPATEWVMRRILPFLPSCGEEFRRAEPLTRIRDIAHRNDIPQDLKREIKHRLQNKLHRCAGPEDLRTSAEILARITAPGASYSQEFVREFQTFHAELQEFFNATALEDRLRALAGAGDPALAEAVHDFLTPAGDGPPADESLLHRLERLTALRQLLMDRVTQEAPQRRSQLRLADVGLEDHAFTLLSECCNRLGGLDRPGAWAGFLRAVGLALDNLRLSRIDPEECTALRSEIGAWARDFQPGERFHLLRLLATLTRARRLAEDYADRVHALFPPRVEELGRALGVADHAIRVFSEGDIRAHLVFQLSRLIDLGMEAGRRALGLPPWEAVVPGTAHGRLVRAAELEEVEQTPGPLVVLLAHADGDAEIPPGVKGIALAHAMPLLSHLGVRARQGRIPFATCAGPEHLDDFNALVGKDVRLHVTPEGLTLEEAVPTEQSSTEPAPRSIHVPEVVVVEGPAVLPLERAEPATCGAKAAGAWRLVQLATESDGLFRAPRGLVVPFGVMERCLQATPAAGTEYQSLVERLDRAGPDRDGILARLRDLVRALPVPDEVSEKVAAFFGPHARLAVRSSANGEDLEDLAGAGLYESVVDVPPAGVAEAVRAVWASLWTDRAALSRMQAGIPHARIRMAVLVQELVTPDLSFILHTVNPLTGDRNEVLAEVAVGLGEVLASPPVPGAPYRLVCDRTSGTARLTACATFGVALRPGGAAGGVTRERLDYSRVPLSADPDAAGQLGKRLARVAALLEERLGRPQDVEGVWAGDAVHVVQARPQQGL